MISRQHLKFIKSLQKKKFRDQSRKFLVEGEKSVLELIQSDFKINTILVTKRFLDDHIDFMNHKKVQFEIISENILESIGNLKHNHTALAVVEIPEYSSEDIGPHGILPAFDQLQDPGNLGAILRICDWYGINSIILSEDSVEVFNPKVIQASMGSFLRVKVFYTGITDFIHETDIPVIGTSPEGRSVYEFTWPERAIILFGNESKGLSVDLLRSVSSIITIPRFGTAESLNVAVSTAVLLDNFRREKREKVKGKSR